MEYAQGEDRRLTLAPTAAARLVEFLAAQGIDRAFCVPAESYLSLLDSLHGHPAIDLVTARGRRRIYGGG